MKPIVLTFVRHYLPGYKAGGQLRTVANLVDHLGDVFDFRIVTSDRDATDEGAYSGIRPNIWTELGPSRVLYLSPDRRRFSNIARIMRETPHDLTYLNSFFDPDFTLKPLAARRIGLAPTPPCIISPSGEFSAGAIALKAWKKGPFRKAAKIAGLYRGLTWKASSAWERDDIDRIMGGTAHDVFVAAHLSPRVEDIDSSDFPSFYRKADEPIRICFLSRILPMKNLDFALACLGMLDIAAQFDIYGPAADYQYWQVCQRAIERLPAHIKVNYLGPIAHELVQTTIARYDLFFLPTRGENYGHVIAEALAAGTPILISDRTPWRNLVAHGIGWDFPLEDPSSFVEGIMKAARLSPEERSAMRIAARRFRKDPSDREAALTANRHVFSSALLRHREGVFL